jgi:hypothetical protein
VRRVFEIMDEVYRRRGSADHARIVARPVRERELEREQLRCTYSSPSLAPLRVRAERIYDRILADRSAVLT